MPQTRVYWLHALTPLHVGSGTGLGLPLAKHIVEDVHSGKLTVESTLGQGSTFIVALPCAGQITG